MREFKNVKSQPLRIRLPRFHSSVYFPPSYFQAKLLNCPRKECLSENCQNFLFQPWIFGNLYFRKYNTVDAFSIIYGIHTELIKTKKNRIWNDCKSNTVSQGNLIIQSITVNFHLLFVKIDICKKKLDLTSVRNICLMS